MSRELPKGVYFGSGGGSYMAVVRHNTKRHYLGSFPTIAEAEAKVKEFREEYPLRERKVWKKGDKLDG